MQASTSPLLSICIPTYNGAQYLQTVLEALLPQTANFPTDIEVVVVDDASTDDTQKVVKQMQDRWPFRYVSNSINAGMARNIAGAVAHHATGEYVWVLSQHNLPVPGAIDTIIDRLTSHGELDAFQINFRCAIFPAQWPKSAPGGYSGEYDYLCRADTNDKLVKRWEDLLDPATGLATQTYAHIVRREVPLRFWRTQAIGRDFANALDTYTQTCGVAVGMFGKPALYIGEPILTIYNGAQTWGSLEQRARVYLQGLPDLLRLYRSLGWNRVQSKHAEAWVARRAEDVIAELSNTQSKFPARRILRYATAYGARRAAAASVARGVLRGRFPRFLGAIHRLTHSTDIAYSYFFYRSRPARWIRRAH